MKKFLLSFFILTLFTSYSLAQSQMLYGLASSGGIGGNQGTLYKMNSNGTGFTVIHNFQSPDGWLPMGNVIQASNGKLYGCCHEGGDWASCTIWCFDRSTNTYEDVWDFDITNGDFPKSGVVEGPDGQLWGAAHSGGTGYLGVIYSYNIGTDVYTPEYSFTNNGHSPWAVPIFVGNTLYGTTYDDTSTHTGVIYSYNISTDTYVELHHFTGLDGSNPYGNLFQASNGKLYGITYGGGANGQGVVYSYDLGTNTYTNIHDLTLAEGGSSTSSFSEGTNGKIYGMTQMGGTDNNGTIFSINLSNNAFAKVYDFVLANGANPRGDLRYDAGSGLFFGTTYAGGTNNLGTTFHFNPVGNVFTKTFDFDGTLGANPNGALSMMTELSGINEMPEVHVSIYPNPVTDYITISIPDPLEGKISFEIFDASGKLIMNWRENNTAGNYIKSIDMHHLVNGTYTLQISNGTVKSIRKIVK
jgi:uncharacterized repeat protein (TIGR03803 family)